MIMDIDEKTELLIDIDGVILDTEQRIALLAREVGWNEAFKIVNWHEHIYSSKQINGSIDILREVQEYLKRIKLITINQNAIEAREKISYMRDNGIKIPIISVPTKMSKAQVVPPEFYDNNVLLVDDQEKNVIEYINNGGKALLFTEKEYETNLKKVKSLDFLRRVR